jgi:hypothetical protein
MGGVLIMSIRDQEYGASLDLQQLYPFRMNLRFVEVGPVEAEKPPHTIPGPSSAPASNQRPSRH